MPRNRPRRTTFQAAPEQMATLARSLHSMSSAIHQGAGTIADALGQVASALERFNPAGAIAEREQFVVARYGTVSDLEPADIGARIQVFATGRPPADEQLSSAGRLAGFRGGGVGNRILVLDVGGAVGVELTVPLDRRVYVDRRG